MGTPKVKRFNVYVIELAPNVWGLKKIQKQNPNKDPNKPCIYVGQTYLSPEERFENHIKGHKSSRIAKSYGVKLRPDLCRQSFSNREEALSGEADIAESLRSKGYGVWYH